MEWNSGPGQTQPVNKPVVRAASKSKTSFLNMRTASVALVIGIAILIAALASLVAFSKTGSERQYVNSDKMQAVFLNGGQVYFGKITDLNKKFMRVSDIYYLRVNQTVQPNQQAAGAAQATNANDISLVKLGCELHGPEDSMVINQDQVIFWENLKDDGQVVKAVATYKEQNPNGQDCAATQGTGAGTNTPAAETPAPPATPAPAAGTNRTPAGGTGTNNTRP